MDYYMANLRREQDEQRRKEQRMSNGGYATRDDYRALALALLPIVIVALIGFAVGLIANGLFRIWRG